MASCLRRRARTRVGPGTPQQIARSRVRLPNSRIACVAGGMPHRYVSAVNDERLIRATCGLSNSAHMKLLHGVWLRRKTTHRNHSGEPAGSPSTHRENMKAISRVLVALVATIAALFASTGTSHAGLD